MKQADHASGDSTGAQPANRVAIVTGAARGIGLATARLMLADGTSVVMVDSDGDELSKATSGLNNVLPLNLDISDPEQVSNMVSESLAHFKQIDCLVNNAGIADFGPIEKTSFATWRRVMATNLDGVFLCSQAATGALKETRGCIVNIASISGLRASTLRTAYGTSKAAVIHLTQQQAAELGEFGIRSNCVAPGPVRTKLAMAVHTQDIIDAYHDAIPLNRYGSEQEIAGLITFLCSDDASYISGQVIHVNGGSIVNG